MNKDDLSHYSVYRTVIEQVMKGTENLPSLPSITLRVRQELSNPYTSNARLAALIERDPALCALIIKNTSNPLYNTAAKPKNLEGILSLLGMARINEIVMLHSVKSLYTFKNSNLKKLYQTAWRRLITKAVLSSVLARSLKFPETDQVMMSSLLSEVGTLAVLSALSEIQQIPDEKTYVRLCREYSKSLGIIILNKWGMNHEYIKVLKLIGQWQLTSKGKIDLVDIINLGLYQSILWQSEQHDLPEFEGIAAFKKLSPASNLCNDRGTLVILESRKESIQGMLKIML